jgi:hypothetical protein
VEGAAAAAPQRSRPRSGESTTCCCPATSAPTGVAVPEQPRAPWKSEAVEYRDTKPGAARTWTLVSSTTPRSRSGSSQESQRLGRNRAAALLPFRHAMTIPCVAPLHRCYCRLPDSQVSTVVPLTLRKPGLRAEGRIMLICVGHTALQRAAARTAVACVPAIEPCLTPAGAAAVDCARCCPLSAVSSRRQGPALSSCSRTHVRHHRALVHKL